MSQGEFNIDWEEVGDFMMPTIKGDMAFKVKVEPNNVTFEYDTEQGGTFLSMPMDEWLKLNAAIGILQATMLNNARKMFDEHECDPLDGKCNGDCHCAD